MARMTKCTFERREAGQGTARVPTLWSIRGQWEPHDLAGGIARSSPTKPLEPPLSRLPGTFTTSVSWVCVCGWGRHPNSGTLCLCLSCTPRLWPPVPLAPILKQKTPLPKLCFKDTVYFSKV